MHPVLKLVMASSVAFATTHVPAADRSPIAEGVGPAMATIGPITFGPKGVLFTADPMTGSVYALQLDTAGAVPGTAAVPDFDAKAAALLGTSADQVDVRDLAVDPRTHN